MGILQRLLGRREPEQRAFFGAGSYTLGSTIATDPEAAQNLAAVLGAVELIAGSIASLPASIVVDTPDGRAPLPGAAASRLLARPNARQSWPGFVTTMVAGTLLQGNAVSRLELDGRGQVVSLTPVPWPWLLPQIVTTAAGARLAFDLVHSTPEAALLGVPARLLADDCLHLKSRADAGIIGRSVLSRAPDVLGAAIGAQTFASSIWSNGASPSLAISVPRNIDAEGMKRMRAFFDERSAGAHNARKPLFLDAETVVTPIQVSPEDAEVLASRRFSVSDIARLFNVPEPLLQVGSTAPADTAPYLAAFAQLALAPIVAALEAEFDHAVLPAGQHLQLDMAGLSRGAWVAVATAQAVLVQSGIATPNDARRALGLPAHPDGESLRAGNAPDYPADAAGVPSLAPKPGPGATAPETVGTHQNEGSNAP